MTNLRAIQATAVAAFTDEFRQSLPTILAALDAVDRDRSDRAAVKEAHRLIHALKGGASMVGLAAFGYLLNVAEELIETSATGPPPVTDEVVERAARQHAALRRHTWTPPWPDSPSSRSRSASPARFASRAAPADIDALKNLIEIEAREVARSLPLGLRRPARQRPPAADQTAPSARSPAVAGAGAAPRATPPCVEFDVVMTDEVPPELAEVFGEEAKEHLETIARLTLRLSSEPDDRESVQELRRAVHTLKGAAGVVGYKGASKLAHRMEDLLDRAVRGDGGADGSRDAGPGVLIRRAARLDRRRPRTPTPCDTGHPPVRGVRRPGRSWPCLDVRQRNGRVRGRRGVRTTGSSPRA